MQIQKIIFIFISIFIFSSGAVASEAIGFYSRGSLKSASSIEDLNLSAIKLFKSRKKLYSTDEMFNLINEISLFVENNFPDYFSISAINKLFIIKWS